MRKIYISGCGGMLGEAFYYTFRDEYDVKCTDIDLNEDWLSYCDIRDLGGYFKDVKEFTPDILFHFGAFTDLEYCELHSEEAYLTNTIAVENAVKIANSLGIPVLYISTAGIFNGQKESYDDWDQPDPLGVYARSKYQGEKHVQQQAGRYLIFRPGWMMGGGPRKDKKYIQKLMKQIKEGASELFIVDDKLGTPTYTYDFARNVELVLKQELWGLYNLVCDGVTDRLEVATVLLSILGLSEKIKITKVSSDFFKDEYFAPRPSSERLINRKLNLRNLNLMRPWQETLVEYVQCHYQGYL
ncbi:SDR family oxidoreductase [Candidatus Neomarinimicrobiota bacterium]